MRWRVPSRNAGRPCQLLLSSDIVLPALRPGNIQGLEISGDRRCQREHGRDHEQNAKTAFDFSLKHLKKRTVTWAGQATLATQGPLDLRKSSRKRVCWESDEDFALLVAQAQAKHDASQLFISHADQPIAGQEHVENEWTKRRGRTKKTAKMLKGQLMLQQCPPAPAPLLTHTATSPCESSSALRRKLERARLRATCCGYCPSH